MDLDGSDGADSGPSIADLLQFVRGARAPTIPSPDPLEQVSNWLAVQRWMPKGGGLFGSEYARYMAANDPQLPVGGASVPPPVNTADPAVSPFSGLPTGANHVGAVSGSAGVAAGSGSANASSASRDARGGLPGATGGDGSVGPSMQPSADVSGNAFLDYGLTGPADAAQIIDVGNPANRRLRREWERAHNRPWPKDPITGRNYDVAHIRALADGGENTLENIRPMHPAEHLAEHLGAGDFARWARRPGIARAFGGVVGAFPILELGSLMLGALSGRIRTNSVDNMLHDMLGEPSLEDRRKQFEEEQKRLNPNWKPGDQIRLEI